MIWFTETQISATGCLKLGLGIPRLSCCANLIYYNAFADKVFTLVLVIENNLYWKFSEIYYQHIPSIL